MENFVYGDNMEILEHVERAGDPEPFNNDDNIGQINIDNFFNADNENGDGDDNDDFNDDEDQNADSSNDEEDSYDSDQDGNALAGAEVDLEVNQAAGEAQEDSLLGGCRRWFIEEDSEDERSDASKHFDWWDEFAMSSSDDEDSPLDGDRGNDENRGQERRIQPVKCQLSLTVTE